MIKNLTIRLKDDKYNRRWKVRQARSLKDAVSAIVHAQVTGSVGNRDTLISNGVVTVMADVVQLNSDDTERKPGNMVY